MASTSTIDQSTFWGEIAAIAATPVPGHPLPPAAPPPTEQHCDVCGGPMILQGERAHSQRRGIIRTFWCTRCNTHRNEHRMLRR